MLVHEATPRPRWSGGIQSPAKGCIGWSNQQFVCFSATQDLARTRQLRKLACLVPRLLSSASSLLQERSPTVVYMPSLQLQGLSSLSSSQLASSYPPGIFAKGNMSFGDLVKAWVGCYNGTPFSQQATANLFPQSAGPKNFVSTGFVARNSTNPQTVALANRAAYLAKAINANQGGDPAQVAELKTLAPQLFSAARSEGLA
jgi:hypothetical protein